ncbi:hypothetical protein BLNAU_17025 [Blattamonas nauphoetae]|uniref:Uncharacterized protein n=1 Tax=Blattamonas nauphoetae TaxID=2049346 RepID=A0ABQ9X9Z1_9EUKA|nr:hypothetical protein BLNAU_17025 [Blattamonas nauphoetae]
MPDSNLIMSFPLLSKCSVLVHSSTHTEIEEEWKRRTQAEMVTTGRGHQHSLAWSDEVGIAVLMSVEWIWEESGTDEERVTKLGELARQLPFF